MNLRKYVSINYTDLLPTRQSECSRLTCDPKDEGPYTSEFSWGKVNAMAVSMPYVSLIDLEAKINQCIHIRQHEDRECTTVNSCFALRGQIESSFSGLCDRISIGDGKHNFIYKPVLQDDHFIERNEDPLRVLHLSIDRMYFLRLLTCNEKWCDDLRTKLERKECIMGSPDNMDINPAIHRIITDITNSPLTGSLRNLLLEAKILELIAYQLHHFQQSNKTSVPTINKNEKDAFYSLRDYLNESFDQEHSLRSLSKEFGLNEFKLKKGFKDLFGFTVFGYIHLLRMRHAKSLIEDDGLNISQVANRVGYKNPNHFSVAFKKQFGLNPSSIRR